MARLSSPGVIVLTVNPGSSSLKLRVIGPADELLDEEDAPAEGGDFATEPLRSLAGRAKLDAVGYRIVHGGDRFRDAVQLGDEALEYLSSLVPLAPLHQRFGLRAVEVCRELLPSVPHVAAFDTAFHAGLPAAASTYAIPAEWRERWGIRRFGFHGLSHAYAARRAREQLGEGARRCITCHLGAGASLAAVLDGRSVDTTMGFTPLEGLVMATRSGSIDPGIAPWLETRSGASAEQVLDQLEHASGLRALAGTPDMREVLDRAAAADDAAILARDVYLHRLRAGIAAMAAALGGADAIVFTGGVGEHAAEVRERALSGLAFLGDVEVLVVEAREDLEIAREVRRVLA